MSNEHDVKRLSDSPREVHALENPFWRIIRLKTARRRKLRKRVAVPQESFCGLLRAQFPAVPDEGGFRNKVGGCLGKPVDFGAAARRERPRRIDVRSNSVAVVDEVEQVTINYFETIFRAVAAIAFLPLASVTSPVSVTVCDI